MYSILATGEKGFFKVNTFHLSISPTYQPCLVFYYLSILIQLVSKDPFGTSQFFVFWSWNKFPCLISFSSSFIASIQPSSLLASTKLFSSTLDSKERFVCSSDLVSFLLVQTPSFSLPRIKFSKLFFFTYLDGVYVPCCGVSTSPSSLSSSSSLQPIYSNYSSICNFTLLYLVSSTFAFSLSTFSFNL